MRDWRPTTFLRYIETVDSSSRTAIIETDEGRAYLKAINNPQGVHVLACDWLGTKLARRFGLPTFDVSILQITDDDEIPLDGGLSQIGPAFVARSENGIPLGGEKAFAKVTNLDDLAKIIVFDTWTKNCDRHGPGLGIAGEARENLDNLFLSEENAPKGKFILKPIDFGHIITCGRELTPSIAKIDSIREERVYGFFPFFKSHVSRDAIIQESERLRTINNDLWQDLIADLPADWNVSNETKAAIDRFLIGRARFLADEFPRLLPAEPKQGELGFIISEENKNE